MAETMTYLSSCSGVTVSVCGPAGSGSSVAKQVLDWMPCCFSHSWSPNDTTCSQPASQTAPSASSSSCQSCRGGAQTPPWPASTHWAPVAPSLPACLPARASPTFPSMSMVASLSSCPHPSGSLFHTPGGWHTSTCPACSLSNLNERGPAALDAYMQEGGRAKEQGCCQAPTHRKRRPWMDEVGRITKRESGCHGARSVGQATHGTWSSRTPQGVGGAGALGAWGCSLSLYLQDVLEVQVSEAVLLREPHRTLVRLTRTSTTAAAPSPPHTQRPS